MPEPIDQLTGALADRYRIERELGVGGMAIVYRLGDKARAIDNLEKALAADS
jgi:hypothetical protein